eukprot:scaffold10264_cov44-Phaeocystis_antarctica.AAC.1
MVGVWWPPWRRRAMLTRDMYFRCTSSMRQHVEDGRGAPLCKPALRPVLEGGAADDGPRGAAHGCRAALAEVGRRKPPRPGLYDKPPNGRAPRYENR